MGQGGNGRERRSLRSPSERFTAEKAQGREAGVEGRYRVGWHCAAPSCLTFGPELC